MGHKGKEDPFDFFDAIFCLTTNSRAEKYALALKEFEKIGIKDRVRKFNGSVIDSKYADYQFNLPDDQKHYALASASHQAIWNIARESRYSNVLIFEDDLTFVEWDGTVLQRATECLKNVEWELFYLGYNLHGHDIRTSAVSPHLVEVEKGADIRSAHAYCLNSSVFEKVVNTYNPIEDVVDIWMPKHLNKIHCLTPLMTTQKQEWRGHQKQDIFLKNSQKL